MSIFDFWFHQGPFSFLINMILLLLGLRTLMPKLVQSRGLKDVLESSHELKREVQHAVDVFWKIPFAVPGVAHLVNSLWFFQEAQLNQLTTESTWTELEPIWIQLTIQFLLLLWMAKVSCDLCASTGWYCVPRFSQALYRSLKCTRGYCSARKGRYDCPPGFVGLRKPYL